MSKLLIKNLDNFQGQKNLKSFKNYFEGWYFKITNGKDTMAFIPGMSINNQKKKAFIQVITNIDSYYIEYDINEFSYERDRFRIRIGNNIFSKDKIYLDIRDKKTNLKVKGSINYSNHKDVKTNIMGPFIYVPFMECNHAVISMNNTVNGMIKINHHKKVFNNGKGYIEKDWGVSFPKKYIWLQGNDFRKKNTSFMLSIATVPFKILNIKGLICNLVIDEEEYRFATYNGTKILNSKITDNDLEIILKKGDYKLKINAIIEDGHTLLAPIKGRMNKEINESIQGNIEVTLTQNDEVIYMDKSNNCGIEIVL